MRLILATVALVVVLASPAFAQAFNARDGTGNVLPFSYGPGGTRHGPGDPLTIPSLFRIKLLAAKPLHEFISVLRFFEAVDVKPLGVMKDGVATGAKCQLLAELVNLLVAAAFTEARR